MSARIYPSRHDATSLYFETLGCGDHGVKLEGVKVWEMKSVWPHRPSNASSPLEWDEYFETHLTVPNAGEYVVGGEETAIYAGWRASR